MPGVPLAPLSHLFARGIQKPPGPDKHALGRPAPTRSSDFGTHVSLAARFLGGPQPRVEILRIGPERGADNRSTRGQRPPRPPDVERGDMPMPNRLLPPRVRRDSGDRQIDFDQAFRIAVHALPVSSVRYFLSFHLDQRYKALQRLTEFRVSVLRLVQQDLEIHRSFQTRGNICVKR